jgi:hypothetical protein
MMDLILEGNTLQLTARVRCRSFTWFPVGMYVRLLIGT